MKSKIKKLLIIIPIICSFFIASLTTQNTFATEPNPLTDGATCENVLGFRSWNCGINVNAISNQNDLKDGIWIIVSNIAADVTVAAAYLAVGFVIYGGFLYIMSSGDPSKTAAGKKTLVHAITGLAIILLANVILNTIRVILLGKGGTFDSCATAEGCITNPTDLVGGIISWVFAIVGLVAVVFVIMGGIQYMTSAGDAAKAKKARETILYAVIGLAIVIFAQVITSVVTNVINDSIKSSEPTSLIQNIAIKEHYEK